MAYDEEMLEEFEEENEELSDYEKEDLAEDLIRS
jgi:hypothetical protein